MKINQKHVLSIFGIKSKICSTGMALRLKYKRIHTVISILIDFHSKEVKLP